MKIKPRHGIIAAVALLCLGVLLFALVAQKLPVELARVETGPMEVTVDEDGRTRIHERYVVSAPLGGQLRRIELEPGDRVIAGKTLVAVVEPTAPELLDARVRAQLEARLRAAEAQVQLADPRIERARAALELARLELDRALRLSGEKAIAAQDVDRAREAARVAAEDLKAAEHSGRIAEFEREQARAALLRTEPGANPGECAWEMRIVSPITGYVLRVFHEDAGVVTAATRLVELGDPENLEVEIDVLSPDAVQISPGARVVFEQWGGLTPLEGRVRVVEPAGFLKISALGVEEQRVNVIADFVTPAGQRRSLGDAYRVEARIVVWEAKDVLKLPMGALFRSRGQWAVFVARNGRARLTTVEIGHTNGREAEIVAGLAAGDEVVIHASDKVADGVAIELRRRR